MRRTWRNGSVTQWIFLHVSSAIGHRGQRNLTRESWLPPPQWSESTADSGGNHVRLVIWETYHLSSCSRQKNMTFSNQVFERITSSVQKHRGQSDKITPPPTHTQSHRRLGQNPKIGYYSRQLEQSFNTIKHKHNKNNHQSEGIILD